MSAIDPLDLLKQKIKREAAWADYQASLDTESEIAAAEMSSQATGNLGGRRVSIGSLSDEIDQFADKCDFSPVAGAILHHPTAAPIPAQTTKESKLFSNKLLGL